MKAPIRALIVFPNFTFYFNVIRLKLLYWESIYLTKRRKAQTLSSVSYYQIVFISISVTRIAETARVLTHSSPQSSFGFGAKLSFTWRQKFCLHIVNIGKWIRNFYVLWCDELKWLYCTFKLLCNTKMGLFEIYWTLVLAILAVEAATMGDQCDWTGRYVDVESSIILLWHTFLLFSLEVKKLMGVIITINPSMFVFKSSQLDSWLVSDWVNL